MRRKRYRALAIIVAVLLALLGADYLVGYKQKRILTEREALKKKLERLAWYTLRSDIKEVSYDGDKYRISLAYENPFPEEELHIMTPAIRCMVQVGTLWKEVPVHETGNRGAEATVVKIERPLVIETVMEVPFKNFEEIMPGYMHVRVNSVSYVASGAISKEDIAEKNEDFYIYLKPYYADDREMAKKYRFADNKIPIWIPMPPH